MKEELKAYLDAAKEKTPSCAEVIKLTKVTLDGINPKFFEIMEVILPDEKNLSTEISFDAGKGPRIHLIIKDEIVSFNAYLNLEKVLTRVFDPETQMIQAIQTLQYHLDSFEEDVFDVYISVYDKVGSL